MAREHLKPTLLSTAVAAGLAATAIPAHALSLGISGQINKTLGAYDNGANNAWGVFDNINSGSRFRFTGEEDMGGGLKVGGVWEWQWSNTPTSSATFATNGGINQTTATLQDRKTELYFAGKWGQVSLGKGDGAANGSAEVDLSGTTVIDYAGANGCLFGSMNFVNDNGTANGAPTGVTGSALSEFDGESRNDRIRYDTPVFGKVVSVAVSAGNQDEGEVAIWYDQKFNGWAGQLAAAIATTDTGHGNGSQVASTTPQKTSSFSVSWLLKNGLNFTGSLSQRQISPNTGPAPSKPSYSYFKVGYKWSKNAVSLSAAQSKNQATDLSTGSSLKPTSIALSYVYTPVKDVEIYASIAQLSCDSCTSAGGQTASKITGYFIGSRIKWK